MLQNKNGKLQKPLSLRNLKKCVQEKLNDLEKEEKVLRITADQADLHYHKLTEWGK
jgi:hypothetical protein